MKVYRGDLQDNFKVDLLKKSRYGFPALFFATKIDLAKLYAAKAASDFNTQSNGCIYECTISDFIPVIDLNGEFSYSFKFRNLIHRLYRDKIKIVRITNVIDYPSDDYLKIIHSDIIVVYDFNQIKNLKLIDNGR